jgi:esterase/lipase superfamily enzyme
MQWLTLVLVLICLIHANLANAQPAQNLDRFKHLLQPQPAAPLPARVKVDCLKVPVYFATDREKSGPPEYYGGNRRKIKGTDFGTATVSIPTGNLVLNTVDMSELEMLGIRPIKGDCQQSIIPPIKTFPWFLVSTLINQNAGRKPDQIVIFVHGYSAKFSDALVRTGMLSAAGAMPTIAFSWPTSSNYVRDRGSVTFALKDFTGFIDSLSHTYGPSAINIVAHSMGNDLLMQALALRSERTPPPQKLGNIVMVAADLDHDVFMRRVEDFERNAQLTTIYTSSSDLALLISRFINGLETHRGPAPTANDQRSSFALEHASVKVIDYSQLGENWGHILPMDLVGRILKRKEPGQGYVLEGVLGSELKPVTGRLVGYFPSTMQAFDRFGYLKLTRGK